MSPLCCPRDHLPLAAQGSFLSCPDGHAYPVHDGIPVFVLEDKLPKHRTAIRTLDPERVAKILSDDLEPSTEHIDDFVRQKLGAAGGYIYAPIREQITHYPIPRLRLPQGEGLTFLDVGCHWGRWSVAAAQIGYTVTGIDPNFEALVAARRVFRHLGIEAQLICADGRFLPFRDNAFDVVFSYSVLQHFSKDDARMAIREAGRATRSRVVVQMPNKYGIRSLYHQAKRIGRTIDGFDVRYWTPGELLAAFREIGQSELSIDGFFGLGIGAAQESDGLLPLHRIIVAASERLRRYRSLIPVADSLYVTAKKS